ncbi:hypothetical protein N0B44_33965 [Roseibacterium beibuensis]|uniref:hypothetical protein n=1 Tax=[Roseibacterium] beibuensis TaxID=1193142 RepID=UPI00217CDC21|nr:hypothetical protein [Roseibacterium beibuensis]MCS6627920.1 hypothetical protein [Roseibacterium beibuensis]
MASKQEIVDALRAVASHREDDHSNAVGAGDWRGAFQARLTNLIWRTIALSLDLGVTSPRFQPGADPIVLARGLRSDCEAALATVQPTQDKAGPFYKLTTIRDVLQGTLDAVGVLEAWTGANSKEPFFLAARAVALGQAEAELALAEDGHWEQVAKWKAQKIGRPRGSRAQWRLEAAPLIQGWIDEDAQISRENLTDKLEEWLKANWHRLSQTRPRPPQYSSLEDILRDMDGEGLIKLNPVPTKGGKKRKTNRL